MEQTKKKKNEIESPAKRGKSQVLGVKSGVKGLSEEDLARQELWQDAIQELQQRDYASEDEAIQAVIDQVVAKLGIAGEQDQQMRDFLYNALSLDPEIMEDLRKSLNVKGTN